MRFYPAVLSLITAAVLLPAVSSARVIDLDPEAIGVSEANFQELRTSHCYMNSVDAPDTAVSSEVSGMLCDPLLARLAGHIIFRAEHAGEMYQVNDGDGLPSIVRYLPDGFYQANGKLFWVANGRRTRLPDGDSFRRILLTVQRTPSMATYVNSDALTTAQQISLHGRILVLVDQNNSLGYMAETFGSDDPQAANIITLAQKNSSELEQMIGIDLIQTRLSLIKKLPLNNDWQ